MSTFHEVAPALENTDSLPEGNKACLFNLVYYSSIDATNSQLFEVIQVIVERIPRRLFRIAIHSLSHDALQITKNSRMQIKTNSYIPVDEIHILAGSHHLPKIPSIILPKLAPDLPTYLFFATDPSQERFVLPALENFSTRLVFHAPSITQLSVFAKNLLEFSQRSSLDWVDLEWARIVGWRIATAKVFHQEFYIKQMTKTKTIQLTYNALTDPSSLASLIHVIYFQAWLSSRLGWEFVRAERVEETLRIVYHTQDQMEAAMVLVPQARHTFKDGSILSLELLSEEGYHFLLSSEDNPNQIKVHSSSPEKCELPYILPIPCILQGAALIDELLYYPVGDHYKTTLSSLAKQNLY